MRAIKYRELKKLYDKLGIRQAEKHLQEAFEHETAPLKPEDFNVTELARVFFGEQNFIDMREGRVSLSESLIQESGGIGVSYTAFTNITSRIVRGKIMDAYEYEGNALAALVGSEDNVRIDKERLPGLTGIDTDMHPIKENEPYPHVGFGERYQELPRGQKYGRIVPLTREAVFFDQTGQLLNMAAKVGEALAYRKEHEIACTLLGINNNYNYNGTAYNTYQAVAGAAPGNWINIHDHLLTTSWRCIQAAERLFDGMVDPHTGQPIVIGAMTLLCMPWHHGTARILLTAAEVRETAGAALTLAPPPLVDGYMLGPKSRLLRTVANATGDFGSPDDVWLLGDFKKAFHYRTNWPLQVQRAPVMSEAEFLNDVVARFRAVERGVCAVMDPRYVVISSGSCGHSSSGTTFCTPDTWPAIDADGCDAVN